MQNSINDLGKKYGREKQAEEVVTKLNKKSLAFKRSKRKERTDSAYFIRCSGSYLVATEHSYIGDLVKQLGGKTLYKVNK